MVGGDLNATTIKELTPGVTYEIRIRVFTSWVPPVPSAWSESTAVVAAGDTLAPSQPTAPTVASSLIAVQVTHQLGKASGGTFNLEADLHHLEVHADYEPAFVPSNATLLGKLVANAGMLTAQIPAVGSFGISSTVDVYVKIIAVDISGNKSLPSAAASATATLIDSEHISDLTASKITAGTITSDILLAGTIATGTAGARVSMDANGIRAFDVNGNETVDISSLDGSATLTGSMSSTNFETGTAGWHVDAAGSAEFSDLTARGSLTTGTPSANVVSDPSFETTISTAGDVGTWSYSTAQAHTGSQSLKVAGDATATKTHALYPQSAFSAEGVRGSMWLKVDTSGQPAGTSMPNFVGMKVHFYDASHVEISSAMLVQSGQLWSIFCVSEDTEILTARGWLKHHELQAGDQARALDPATGREVWTPVVRVRRFAVAEPIVRLRSADGRVDALATAAHRWWVRRRGTVHVWATTAQLTEADAIPLPSGEFVSLAGFTRTEEPYSGTVWCPTTVAGTWLARRGSSVYFTGNKP
jgi:hypothetical protein